MSAFLGPIHYWLYKKIRLVIDREELLYRRAYEMFDDLAEELYGTALSMYGRPLPADTDLGDIIDHNQIHNWLHHQIEVAEVREATFIKDLVDTLSEDGEECIFEVFYDHGNSCGHSAVDTLESDTASSIYKAMQNYYLNGMPCDASDPVFLEEDDEFVWSGTHQNQLENWKKAGANLSTMSRAYQHWFKGFVEAITPHFTFSVCEEFSARRYRIKRKP